MVEGMLPLAGLRDGDGLLALVFPTHDLTAPGASCAFSIHQDTHDGITVAAYQRHMVAVDIFGLKTVRATPRERRNRGCCRTRTRSQSSRVLR